MKRRAKADHPERSVLDAIDSLVNESLARPITDDYEVDRYDRCALCGQSWHGLPEYVEPANKSCPGAWASEEAVAAWREMFPDPPKARADQVSAYQASADRAGAWTLTPTLRHSLLTGALSVSHLTGSEYRIALYAAEAAPFLESYPYGQVPGEVGTPAGGLAVRMATRYTSVIGSTEVVLTANVTWRAHRRRITAHYFFFYNPEGGEGMCHCSLGRNGVTINPGHSLTLSSENPLLRVEGPEQR